MDFSSANTSLWNPVIQIGVIAVLVLLANILRRKVKLIRASLIPTAVLAGFILLIIKTTGVIHIDSVFLEKLTYHALGMGFIALSLRVPEKDKSISAISGAKSGALIVGTYLVQALSGLAVTLILAYTFMPDLFKASGILLAMGYGQGPGQANNIGRTYEEAGMQGGQSFGLSIAAAGFLCACIVGVIYLNVLSRKHKFKRVKDKKALLSEISIETYQHDNEIPIAESIDKLSIQFALVALMYLITYLITYGVIFLLGLVSEDVANTASSILWGFNFIIGSLVATVARIIIGSLRKTQVMKRQYQNNYLLSRISGLAFDLMIVSGIASINFEDLQGYWIPFVILAVAGGLATFFFLVVMCRKMYPDYKHEAFLGMFGMLTGTISSGVLLLREVDPEFETPASNHLIVGSSFAIAFGIPMLLLVMFASNGDTATWISFGLGFVYFAALVAFILIGKKKNKNK